MLKIRLKSFPENRTKCIRIIKNKSYVQSDEKLKIPQLEKINWNGKSGKKFTNRTIMKKFKINIINSRESFKIIYAGEFEYCNPFEKLFEALLYKNLILEKSKLMKALPLLSESEIDKLIFHRTFEENLQESKDLVDMELPEGLLKIFNLETKDAQTKSLKGISLSSKEMMAFILKAFSDYGFTYSLYKTEHHHNGLNENRIPTFFCNDENGNIISTGDTDMTEGEIKQMIEQRKVIIAKFLDLDERWHCFFWTYKSLGGKEYSHKDGQPHMHYISHAFGMSRERVLKELKSKRYKLSAALHIDFYTHRNPRQSILPNV